MKKSFQKKSEGPGVIEANLKQIWQVGRTKIHGTLGVDHQRNLTNAENFP
jgi:hypothetical protein